MSTLTAESAVYAGAKFLDTHPRVNPTWRMMITPETLSMSSCFSCLLGQLAVKHNWYIDQFPNSPYMAACRVLGLDVARSGELGFDYHDDTNFYEVALCWRRTLDSTGRAVRTGIKFLNSHPEVPGNWPNLININRLNMANGFDCILGQLSAALEWRSLPAPYMCGLQQLGLSKPLARELGFDFIMYHNTYAQLETEWRKAIMGLREGTYD